MNLRNFPDVLYYIFKVWLYDKHCGHSDNVTYCSTSNNYFSNSCTLIEYLYESSIAQKSKHYKFQS